MRTELFQPLELDHRRRTSLRQQLRARRAGTARAETRPAASPAASDSAGKSTVDGLSRRLRSRACAQGRW